MGATDIEGRLLSSIFRSGPVEPIFCNCLDVPNGGVLLGLPALLSMGLLRHTGRYFHLPDGYYRIDSIFLLLSFIRLLKNSETSALMWQGI
ncbi:MAG: hypothetical protein V1706_03220 [Pseudomonadota bacterium]